MEKTNRFAMCALAVAVSCMLVGCSNTAQQAESDDASAQQTVQGGTTPVTADATTLDGIVDAIENDFETTETDITTKLDDVKAKAGGSYADYVENSSMLTDWLADAQAETEALISRTDENAAKYYTLLAQQAPTMDWNDISDSMTAFYRAVYDDAFSNLYRSVYTDAYKNVYRTFYDSVMKDAYNTVSYKEASDASSSVYRAISDAQSSLYRTISDAQSNTYRTYSDVHSEFYNDNYDLSKVLGD